MFDKYESCKDCPDRTIEPNCHDTCEGYIFRVEESEKLKKLKRKDNDYNNFKREAVGRIKKYTSNHK